MSVGVVSSFDALPDIPKEEATVVRVVERSEAALSYDDLKPGRETQIFLGPRIESAARNRAGRSKNSESGPVSTIREGLKTCQGGLIQGLTRG